MGFITLFKIDFSTLKGGFTMKNILITISLLFLMVPGISLGATRIFYEDCEYTEHTTHFLERAYGSGNQRYWDEMVSEITQSSETPYRGNYSMTYDPFTTGNPHALVGYSGALDVGNTSNLDLSAINSRTWYFKWYQRWENDIGWNGAMTKILYVNYKNSGDFTLFLVRTDSAHFLLTLKDRDTYSLVVNKWLTHSGGSLDDMEWHKLEVYVDVGTTGNSDGILTVTVDDIQLFHQTGIRYNGTIHENPMSYLTGWPSNKSGGTPTTTCNTWLDELEIWADNSITDTTAPSAPANLQITN